MKKKNWKDIRSAVVMMCVMVAMMGTATFAWFSLTNSPTVTGLEMTAVSDAGLKISKTNAAVGDEAWVDAIDLGRDPQNLKPVTVTAKEATFHKPNYTGNTVTSVTALGSGDLSGYVAKYTYYLMSEATEPVSVGIITTDPTDLEASNVGIDEDINQANIAGSFLLNEATVDASKDPTASMRVGFIIGNSDELITWEPNSTTTFTEGNVTHAIDGIDTDPITADVISNATGVITSADPTSDRVSQELFTLDPSTPTSVTMYVWIEGQDDECVDQIIKEKILAQVQFTVIEDAVVTP